MAEFRLAARSVFAAVGGCRVDAKGVIFDEAPARSFLSLAARTGQADALAAAMKAAFDIDLPAPGQFATAKGAMALFSGPGQWFLSAAEETLLGRVQDAAQGTGSVTDQSDSFTALTLSGPRARDVLMRLSSLDFDDPAFPTGSTARTPMQQIGVIVARTGDGPDYLLNTPRSTARGFAHDVKVAIAAVLAR